MFNSMLCRKLFVVAAASMNSNLCRKLFFIHPSHFRNVFSTEAHPQTLFSQFASTKLNLSEADITRIFKSQPRLQNLRTLDNVEKVINLLKKHGLTEIQITNIVRMQPNVIGSAETILEPKLKLLENFGFVGRDLAKLITKNTYFLCHSLEQNILPKMEFLKNVFQSQEVLVKALLKAPRIFSCSLEKTLKPSLAFWEGWGFSGTELVSFLKVNPTVLTRTSLIPTKMDLINEIGAKKESKMYKYIVSLVAVSRVETLEAKIENLKLCGLSAEEAFQILGSKPLLFCLSKENVRKKMNFVVNNMELPANYVVKHPNILTFSLEKIVRPRFLVWKKIKCTSDFNTLFSTVLQMTEARFVNNIIKGYPESKTLWTIYENAVSNASKHTMSSTET